MAKTMSEKIANEWKKLMNYTFAERSVSLYEWCGGYDYPYYENENGGQMVIPPLKDKEEIREFVDGWRRTAQRCVEEMPLQILLSASFISSTIQGKTTAI